MGAEIVYATLASIVAAALSAFVALRTKRSDVMMAVSANNSMEIQHIFDGYARIVEDLQNEVLRLQAELEIVRAEQKECDHHRLMLADEVVELKRRIVLLEGGTDEQ